MNNGVNGYCFFVNPCMGEHKTWHQHKTAKVSRQTLLTLSKGCWKFKKKHAKCMDGQAANPFDKGGMAAGYLKDLKIDLQ